MNFKNHTLANKVAVMLLFPYIVWLSKFNEAYTSRIDGKPLVMNFDGVMQMLHNLMSNANMLIHESGHGVCYLIGCPDFIMFINGTIFQLALPIIFIYIYMYKTKNIIIAIIGVMWLAQNLVYVAWYMSTSQMPHKYGMFLGGGTHDFWWLFSYLGVLEYDWLISSIVKIIAVVLLYGAYFYLVFLVFFKSDKENSKKIILD